MPLEPVKVIAIVNTVTPYTSGLFSVVHRQALVRLKVFYCSERHKLRPKDWAATRHAFDSEILPGFHIYLKGSARDPIHFNPRVMSAVRLFKPDVIVLYGYSDVTNLLALIYARIAGIPIVLELDGARIEAQGMLKRQFIKSVVRMCSAFIAACGNAREFLVQFGAVENRVFMIPCVQGLARIRASAKSPDVMIEDSSIVSSVLDRNSLLYVGRLVKEKGVLELAEVFSRLWQDDRHVQLVLVGAGPLKGRLQEVLGHLPKESVLSVDYVSERDLNLLYRSSGVFVLPSRIEPFGIVALEAFVAGLPVVVSNSCGVASLLPDSPWTIRFPTSNIAALAEAIRKGLDRSKAPDTNEHSRIIEELISGCSEDRLASIFADAIKVACHDPRREQ